LGWKKDSTDVSNQNYNKEGKMRTAAAGQMCVRQQVDDHRMIVGHSEFVVDTGQRLVVVI
jgi:hypothetical protein